MLIAVKRLKREMGVLIKLSRYFSYLRVVANMCEGPHLTTPLLKCVKLVPSFLSNLD